MIVLCVTRLGYCHEFVTDYELGIKGPEYFAPWWTGSPAGVPWVSVPHLVRLGWQ